MDSYYSKKIKIKNKVRFITTYSNNESGLKQKEFDEKAKELLIKLYQPSEFSFAYQKNKSIFDNVSVHKDNTEFVLIDIKNFFPSINIGILKKEIATQIRKNNSENILDTELIDPLINRIVLTNYQGIQQGLICSPVLSDIYMTSFDDKMFDLLNNIRLTTKSSKRGFLNKFNVKYSRYADDITISFYPGYVDDPEEIQNCKERIVTSVRELLKNYKLSLNDKKIHYISSSTSKSVKITGLNLNFVSKKIRVSKKYINSFFWEVVNLSEHKNVYYKSMSLEQSYEYVKQLIGKESYISSIDNFYFETEFSPGMKSIVYNLGYDSLKSILKEKETALYKILQKTRREG
jgi:hypothetical protein